MYTCSVMAKNPIQFNPTEIVKKIRENEAKIYSEYLEQYKTRVNILESIDIDKVTTYSLLNDVSKLDELISTSKMDTKLQISQLPPFNGKSTAFSDMQQTISTLHNYNTDIDNKIESLRSKDLAVIPEGLVKLSQLSTAFTIFMYKLLSYQVQSELDQSPKGQEDTGIAVNDAVIFTVNTELRVGNVTAIREDETRNMDILYEYKGHPTMVYSLREFKKDGKQLIFPVKLNVIKPVIVKNAGVIQQVKTLLNKYLSEKHTGINNKDMYEFLELKNPAVAASCTWYHYIAPTKSVKFDDYVRFENYLIFKATQIVANRISFYVKVSQDKISFDIPRSNFKLGDTVKIMDKTKMIKKTDLKEGDIADVYGKITQLIYNPNSLNARVVKDGKTTYINDDDYVYTVSLNDNKRSRILVYSSQIKLDYDDDPFQSRYGGGAKNTQDQAFCQNEKTSHQTCSQIEPEFEKTHPKNKTLDRICVAFRQRIFKHVPGI